MMFGNKKRLLKEYLRIFKELSQLKIIGQELKRSNELMEKQILEQQVANFINFKMIKSEMTDEQILDYIERQRTKLQSKKDSTLIK